MMKKIVFLIIITFFLSSCVKITENYADLVNKILTNQKTYSNQTFQGFSLYLPKGVQVKTKNSNNLVLRQNNNTMYLYVDLISYFNKVKKEYQQNTNAYFSMPLKNNDYFGYVEINLWKDNKYLVEIMYNYAKIEVIVSNKEIKNVLSYAATILSSITYNDTIILNMIGEDILNYNELEFNIFETTKSSNGAIQYDENSSFDREQNAIPDLDLIN